MLLIEGDDRYEPVRALGPNTWVARAVNEDREVVVKRVTKPPPELYHTNLPTPVEQLQGYAVYDLIDGVSLAELARQGRRLSARETERWSSQVLEALQYVHGLGIAHGDVDAENVLICADRETFLVDAGLKDGTATADLEALSFLRDR